MKILLHVNFANLRHFTLSSLVVKFGIIKISSKKSEFPQSRELGKGEKLKKVRNSFWGGGIAKGWENDENPKMESVLSNPLQILCKKFYIFNKKNSYFVLFCHITGGCPKACNNNGACQLFQDGWKCSCRDGWKGLACEVAMENECEDGVDDDTGM